jgi:hypothetical protein
MRVVFYVLTYGDYHELHRRCIDSLYRAIPQDMLSERGDDDSAEVLVWGNDVCKETADPAFWERYPAFRFVNGRTHSKETALNVPKYELMRDHMFKFLPPDDFDWMVWLDDDSHITQVSVWFGSMMKLIADKQHENICYIGEPWFWAWRRGQWGFVTKSKWYKGVPAEVGGKGTRNEHKRITFAQGGLWWLRTDIRRLLDWPDPRLSHNGGDTLLAEAVRQQGLPFHKAPGHRFGYRTNDAKRRGYWHKPAGEV